MTTNSLSESNIKSISVLLPDESQPKLAAGKGTFAAQQHMAKKGLSSPGATPVRQFLGSIMSNEMRKPLNRIKEDHTIIFNPLILPWSLSHQNTFVGAAMIRRPTESLTIVRRWPILPVFVDVRERQSAYAQSATTTAWSSNGGLDRSIRCPPPTSCAFSTPSRIALPTGDTGSRRAHIQLTLHRDSSRPRSLRSGRPKAYSLHVTTVQNVLERR